MTDIEMCLLAWAVTATVAALKYSYDAALARTLFMRFVRDEKARATMLADWDAFKKVKGITE